MFKRLVSGSGRGKRRLIYAMLHDSPLKQVCNLNQFVSVASYVHPFSPLFNDHQASQKVK